MTRNWDEELAALSADLIELSQKAAYASEEAKAAMELGQEVIGDQISTAKGNVIALQETLRIAGEKNKSKLSSTLLKAQMLMEEMIRQEKEKTDKTFLESYIDKQFRYIKENFETASYLIANTQLAILEVVQAINEYDPERGAEETGTEKPEETAPANEEEA